MISEIPVKKRVLYIVASLISASLVIYSVNVTIKHFSLVLDVCFALEQVEVFHAVKEQIKSGNDNRKEIASQLNYIINYYPSGTKQEKGSRLDRIVESARKDVLEDLIIFLKGKLNEDYGSVPEKWVESLNNKAE